MPAKGRRSPVVMMHLPREPSDDVMRTLIRECMRGHVDSMGQAPPPTWEEGYFQISKRSWGRVLNYYMPERFTGNGLATQLSIELEMPIWRDLSTLRRFDMPGWLRGSREWVPMSANSAHVDHMEPGHMDWFLGKARCPLDILQPDFAFADIDTTLYKNLHRDPREFAWPLMIFGPDQVKKYGRDMLLDSPAWKVEELPNGSIWVQTWQNPFDTPQKMVAALGKHLGLEARPS